MVTRALALIVFIASLMWLPVIAQNSSNLSPQSNSQVLSGQVMSFGILTEELQSDLGIKCTRNGSTVEVSQVRMGSEAYYRGLQQGDQLMDAKVQGNQIFLSVSRDHKPFDLYLQHIAPKAEETPHFAVNIPRSAVGQPPFPLQADQFGGNVNRSNFNYQQGRMDQGRKRRLRGRANRKQRLPEDDTPAIAYVVDPNKVRLLANYNIELIVDRSLSMRQRDCPGAMSRWDWCGYQAADIARALTPYIAGGVTVTPFAGEFDEFEHCSSQNVMEIFERHNFTLGTRLYEPLAHRLDTFFAHHKPGDKPLLITVITDGLPWPSPEPLMVRNELINASRQISSPGEVVVVFMQIGGQDPKGRDYLLDLGTNLVGYGAQCQYVHTKTFEELKQVGLGNALGDAISRYATQSDLNPPPTQPAMKRTASSETF